MKRRAYGGETGEGKSGEIVSALSANDVGKKGAGGGGRGEEERGSQENGPGREKSRVIRKKRFNTKLLSSALKATRTPPTRRDIVAF